MPAPTRARLGVLLIAITGLVLLGIGMFDGEIVEPVLSTPAIPGSGTLAEQSEALGKVIDETLRQTRNPDIGINLFSNLGKGLVITPFLAGGFALHRLLRPERSIPTRTIAELAIVTSLIAVATVLVRLTVAAESGGPLAALSRALGADRGVDVTLTAGGQLTVVTLVVMFVAGLVALDIGGRATPGEHFSRQDR